MTVSEILSIFLIIFFTVAVALYFRYRVSLLHKKIRKEADEAEETVDNAFYNLREKIEKEIEFLDKEPGLSEGERELRDKLQEALESSEEVIKKEVKDIKKTID